VRSSATSSWSGDSVGPYTGRVEKRQNEARNDQPSECAIPRWSRVDGYGALRSLDAGSDALLDECGDFTGLGMTSKRSLGVDQRAIEGHLESAFRRRHQVDTGDDRRPSGKQFGRQTDGARYVVSGNAELDLEVVTRI
jgi:hypothetical protein